ncbi:MAG TPA: acyl carrier protein [Longimicrobiales bacterium]|nr:acyl carrier protein [Longimicrobiales bacterium]
MSIETKLRRYILENFLFTEDEEALSNGDSFLERGIVDSTGIMEVIFFVEEEFGFNVEDEEMVPENLDSIDALVAFVGRKQAG